MSIMTIETTITRKYLLGKSKSDLACMYLELLERAVAAEAERDAAREERNKAQRFVNENYALIQYWRDLFKRANAAKRKARTEVRVLRLDARTAFDEFSKSKWEFTTGNGILAYQRLASALYLSEGKETA